MKNKIIFTIPFLGKKNNELKNSLLFISIAIGASIGYYFIKKKIFTKPLNKIGELSSNLRMEIKNSSSHLLGDFKDRDDLTKIDVPEAGTLNWRKNREKSIFPPIPDPNIRIN